MGLSVDNIKLIKELAAKKLSPVGLMVEIMSSGGERISRHRELDQCITDTAKALEALGVFNVVNLTGIKEHETTGHNLKIKTDPERFKVLSAQRLVVNRGTAYVRVKVGDVGVRATENKILAGRGLWKVNKPEIFFKSNKILLDASLTPEFIGIMCCAQFVGMNDYFSRGRVR